MKPFKVGIDVYGLKPLGLSPFRLLEWAAANGAEGVQFSEAPAEAADPGFLRELGREAARRELYLEWGGGQHIPADLATGAPKDITETNRLAADQAVLAGAATVRSCSGGLMRWNKTGPTTEAFLREMARFLAAQKSVFLDRGVTLAIETHFEFTTFELLRVLDMSGAEPGGGLGICLDTMNLLTMLEEPVAAVRRIRPFIATTHVKDGGILLTDEGFVTFTAEAGRGVIDFRSIFEELSALPIELRLSIEDHGGDFRIPVFDPKFLSEFPDFTAPELCDLLRLSRLTREKMKSGGLAVLDRKDWPSVGEERIKRDLRFVRALVGEGRAGER